jgi:hypothetical protein
LALDDTATVASAFLGPLVLHQTKISTVRHRETRPFFADLDPPQTFALRADEILGNERQTVWRSGRALQA